MTSTQPVLVTGAAGFIGSRTSAALLASGRPVIGIDNLNDYYDPRIKHHRLEKLTSDPNFTFHRTDITSSLDPIFSDHHPDAVINLAAMAGVRNSIEHPADYISTNVSGTLNLMDAMVRHGVTKLVLASTSSLYAGQKMPFSEDLAVNTPMSPYAASKKAAEALAYSYHYIHGLDISVLRYFTVFGPAGRPDMCIFRFIKWIDEQKPLVLYGDGSQSRDFTYVEDIAQGTLKALRPLGYEVINIGGGQNPVSLSTVISHIEDRLHKKADISQHPFQKVDIKETRADISKARSLLDWAPQTSVEKGLDLTLEWHTKNASWLRDIDL